MRRIKLLGLVLIAVFASAAAVVATASAALPKNLPEVGVERTWTGKATSTPVELLHGSTVIKCTEAPATGTEKSKTPLGLFHIEFQNCTTMGGTVKCTGLGDKEGAILALGEWHLVFDQLTPTLLSAILFLLEPVHFNCSALVLVIVLGTLVCLHLNPTVKAFTHEFHCTVETVGGVEKQQDEKYFDANGKEVKASLLCGENHPEKELACFELALGDMTYKEEIFADI